MMKENIVQIVHFEQVKHVSYPIVFGFFTYTKKNGIKSLQP